MNKIPPTTEEITREIEDRMRHMLANPEKAAQIEDRKAKAAEVKKNIAIAELRTTWGAPKRHVACNPPVEGEWGESLKKLKAMLEPSTGRLIGIVGTRGNGKCFARGTMILMFDGTSKPVESIEVGDVLIGPDSLPRKVTSLANGEEEMFVVYPVKGTPYTVNASHILSLRKTGTMDVVNICVRDYLNLPKSKKSLLVGWRSGVDFSGQKTHTDLPPYILGLWIGDGEMKSNSFSISKPDREIFESISSYAEYTQSRVSEYRGKNGDECPRLFVVKRRKGNSKSRAVKALQHYGLHERKRIPLEYKTATTQSRLELLAGLMDSDGHLQKSGGYDFINKHREIAEDVAFVARSVGLAAYIKECRKSCQNGFTGTYWRVSISGHCDKIPCRIGRKKAKPRKQVKNVLHTGISLSSIGSGQYFGFTIEGPDRLFLLDDFTVVHNTQLSVEAMKFKTELLHLCRFTTAVEFFIRIKATYRPDAEHDEMEVLKEFQKPKLLVIDEIGKRGSSDWENTMLFELLNRRYNDMNDTILIDNRSRQDFTESIGPSLASRMSEGGGIMECGWESFRS